MHLMWIPPALRLQQGVSKKPHSLQSSFRWWRLLPFPLSVLHILQPHWPQRQKGHISWWVPHWAVLPRQFGWTPTIWRRFVLLPPGWSFHRAILKQMPIGKPQDRTDNEKVSFDSQSFDTRTAHSIKKRFLQGDCFQEKSLPEFLNYPWCGEFLRPNPERSQSSLPQYWNYFGPRDERGKQWRCTHNNDFSLKVHLKSKDWDQGIETRPEEG